MFLVLGNRYRYIMWNSLVILTLVYHAIPASQAGNETSNGSENQFGVNEGIEKIAKLDTVSREIADKNSTDYDGHEMPHPGKTSQTSDLAPGDNNWGQSETKTNHRMPTDANVQDTSHSVTQISNTGNEILSVTGDDRSDFSSQLVVIENKQNYSIENDLDDDNKTENIESDFYNNDESEYEHEYYDEDLANDTRVNSSVPEYYDQAAEYDAISNSSQPEAKEGDDYDTAYLSPGLDYGDNVEVAQRIEIIKPVTKRKKTLPKRRQRPKKRRVAGPRRKRRPMKSRSKTIQKQRQSANLPSPANPRPIPQNNFQQNSQYRPTNPIGLQFPSGSNLNPFGHEYNEFNPNPYFQRGPDVLSGPYATPNLVEGLYRQGSDMTRYFQPWKYQSPVEQDQYSPSMVFGFQDAYHYQSPLFRSQQVLDSSSLPSYETLHDATQTDYRLIPSRSLYNSVRQPYDNADQILPQYNNMYQSQQNSYQQNSYQTPFQTQDTTLNQIPVDSQQSIYQQSPVSSYQTSFQPFQSSSYQLRYQPQLNAYQVPYQQSVSPQHTLSIQYYPPQALQSDDAQYLVQVNSDPVPVAKTYYTNQQQIPQYL